MPTVGSPRIVPGELWVNEQINLAQNRARAEQRIIYLRRSTDGFYAMLIQAEDEISPIENERLKPKLYATAYPDGTVKYAGSR